MVPRDYNISEWFYDYTLRVVGIQWFLEITTLVSGSMVIIIFDHVNLSHILKLKDSIQITLCDMLKIAYLNLHRANNSKKIL